MFFLKIYLPIMRVRGRGGFQVREGTKLTRKVNLSQVSIAVSNHHKIYLMMRCMPILKKPHYSPIFECQEDLGRIRKGDFTTFGGGSQDLYLFTLLSHNKSVEKTNGFLHGHRTVIFHPTLRLVNKKHSKARENSLREETSILGNEIWFFQIICR